MGKRSNFFSRINKNDKNIYFLVFQRKNVHFVTIGSEIKLQLRQNFAFFTGFFFVLLTSIFSVL